jgi:hypothetical protein
MVANLGPILLAMDGLKKVSDSLKYNPRCVSRDLSAYTASSWLTTENSLNLTTGDASKSVKLFQDEYVEINQNRTSNAFANLVRSLDTKDVSQMAF